MAPRQTKPAARAKVFWSGRSQAVRLPREFRFAVEEVAIRREGRGLVLEPLDEWPAGYVDSFTGVGKDFARPRQGRLERRQRLP